MRHRRFLVLAGLAAWAAFTIATTVLAVLWVTDDGEGDDLAEDVRVNGEVWDDWLTDLRDYETTYGSVWTVEQLRPKAYNDVAIAGLDSWKHPGQVQVVTLRDAERAPCVAGEATVLDSPVLTICPDSARGHLSASVDLDDPQAWAEDGFALVSVSEWRSMPRATDARIDLAVQVPLPADPTADALRGTLERAVELTDDRLSQLQVERVDLTSPSWTDYGFMFDLQAWQDQPAAVVTP